MDGFHIPFLIASAVVALSLLLALFLPRQRAATGTRPSESASEGAARQCD